MNKSRKRLLDIFDKIDDPVRPLNLHYQSKILIVDGMNTFLRSFAAVNQHNNYGNHVGGLTGFLKSIGSAIKILQPTRCIIVFDGEGGSTNRKYLYPEYKGKRNTPKLVNYKSFSNKTDEDQAKYDEIVRLMDYLELLPVVSIAIDRLEADDIIGYITNKVYEDYTDSNVYIMSSDNDFLQLVNDRVFVFNPTKKITYDEDRVLRDFKVHPKNFLLYKTLVGDASDNIPGVAGFGEKNTPLLFENFSLPKRHNLEEIYDLCKNPPKNSVLYDRILRTTGMVEIFYKIMNLSEPNIMEEDKEEITRMIYTKPPPLQKYLFMQQIKVDRITDSALNGSSWVDLFGILNNF